MYTKKKREWSKGHIIFWIVVIMVVFSPIIIAKGTSAPILTWATNNNDWIGFWGGYCGAILGGLITLFVLWMTLEEGRKSRFRDEKNLYFENLLNMQVDWCKSVAELFEYWVKVLNEYTAKAGIELDIFLQESKEDSKNQHKDRGAIIEEWQKQKWSEAQNRQNMELIRVNTNMVMINFKLRSYLQIKADVFDLSEIKKAFEKFDEEVDAVWRDFNKAEKSPILSIQKATDLTEKANNIRKNGISDYLKQYSELAGKQLK